MRRAVVIAVLLSAAPAAAQIGTNETLHPGVPSRPFLLVDAPRRFVPGQEASVRVQLRDGGRVRVSVFRVHDPATLLGQAARRQGMQTARTPIGAETERLVAGTDPLPRRGGGMTLLSDARYAMPRADGPREVSLELEVYDSNEDVEDNVATYWVRTGSWSVRRLAVGALPRGLYLVQVRAGPWVSSTLLSSGELVLLARRGDTEDLIRVTGPEGAPKRGVQVEAWAGARRIGAALTGPDGVARMPARGAEEVRFVARRGDDLAWTDVSHVRLRPCDPRVYVATGRPVYRDAEEVYVRGHVRGCEGDGFGPLANRVVQVEAGGASVEARTDTDGNFVAQVRAGYSITATLAGREHRRTVQIDQRDLPRRALVVEADRAFARVGETVRVRVADTDGGWPHAADVVLDTPSGRFVGSVGPGRAAVFDVPVPPTGDVVERMTLDASLTEAGRVTMASGELWIGRSALALEIVSPRERGATGEAFTFDLVGTDLRGGTADGPVELTLFGSDGNRPVGEVRERLRASLVRGRVHVQLPLAGAGPWWIEARRERAAAHLVVWARRRPPSLARRGALALMPRRALARPGETLEVDVRMPGGGAGWLTLEQGGVLVSRHVPASRRRVRVPIPDEGRGLASLVLTHVSGGRVQTATSTVEVETARPVELTVQTDSATYARGTRASVHVEAKDEEGAPRDGVVSLWLADAGYWGLGEETYPLPNDYFRLPGRPASGGDSSRPISYGAEEGRRVDSELMFDGRRLPRASHRHAWGHGGELIRVRRRGTLAEVWATLARAAGFGDSRIVCPDERGDHRLRVRDLPWDLVLDRLSDAVPGRVSLEGDTLVLECGSFGGGGAGGLSGRRARVPRIRSGAADMALFREERLEGTLHFIGLRRLGPDGAIDLDVPLPDHPGRWRIEVLAIADDGGGARGHRVVHTRQPLEAWLDAPRALRVGDRADTTVRVRAPGLASRSVTLQVTLPPALAARGPLPTRVALDDRGVGEARLPIEAVDEGAAPLTLRASAGAEHDALTTAIDVLPRATIRDLTFEAPLGPDAVDVEIPLPELTRGAQLTVVQDASLEAGIGRALDALRRPRWDVAFVRADRLQSMLALNRALRGRQSGAATLLRSELRSAIQSELAQLASLRTSNGELGWGDRPDRRLTLEVLSATRQADGPFGPAIEESFSAMYERARRDELRGVSGSLALQILGTGLPEATVDHTLARARATAGEDLDAVGHLARAAHAAERAPELARARRTLARQMQRRLSSAAPRSGCRGPAWFLCFARHGDRGAMARAAITLLDTGHPRARQLAARTAGWIARHPPEPSWLILGSDTADALELFARLDGDDARAPEPVEARLDDRPVPVRGGRVRVPAGAHRLTLRFATRDGRFRRIGVRGRVSIAPPANTLGNAGLERSIRQRDGGWELVVGFTLPRPSSGVTVRVPLPAGLTADRRRIRSRHLDMTNGAVRLRYGALRRGHHEVRIPLIALGRGSYAVGSAQLTTEDAVAWGVTGEQRIALGPISPAPTRPAAPAAP